VVELAIPNGGDDPVRACRPHRRQFWLMDAPPRLLLDLCNDDGYGAAGVGDDRVTVGPNRITHTQNGGSAWRWSTVRVVQLSPLQVQRDAYRDWWSLGPNVSQSEWDWRRFAGTASWWAPPCDSGGAAPDNVRAPTPLPYEYAPIPRLTAPAVPANATDAELGSCALAVDAAGRGGYVVAGQAAPATPATAAANEWLRALQIDDGTVMITIGNGPWTTPSSGAAVANDDHVEIWLGGRVGYGAHCLDPRDQPTRWLIAIPDARLTLASGDPARRFEVVVRRERQVGAGNPSSGSVVTFVLRLPPDTPSLTAVLARGDGRRPGRAIATSRLRARVAASVGQVMALDAAGLRCAVRDGRLDLIETGRPEMLLREP
jgi:hypothetical protein